MIIMAIKYCHLLKSLNSCTTTKRQAANRTPYNNIIAGAPWSDGGGCRNQRATRISEIQRHKILEMENNNKGGNQTISTTMISSNSLSTQQSTVLPSPTQQQQPTQSELVPRGTVTATAVATITTNTTVTATQSNTPATESEEKQNECPCDTSFLIEETNRITIKTDRSSVEKLTCDISTINLNENNTMETVVVVAEATSTTASAAATTASIEIADTSADFSNNANINSNNNDLIKRNICSDCINCTNKCDKSKLNRHNNSATRDRRIHSDNGSTIPSQQQPIKATIIKSSTIDRISPTLQSGRIKSINQSANIPIPTVQSPNVPIFTERYPASAHPTYLPAHFRNLPKTQSLDLGDDRAEMLPNLLPKMQSLDQTRPIYPNVPYSPYGSPFGSPRNGRRRAPLRESRRISIEQSGSFLQLNQYKLMDQIGQGSYGLVKLAYSEEDSIHYAMKILSKRKLLRKAGLLGRGPKKGTSPLDRVYREIAVLKKLDHPNVVKLIEVLDDPLEDSLYMVFELLQQGEVLSVPTNTPLTEERAWAVFRDVVLGLEYLHYQRIIHGDIKPDNLLLDEGGRVKMADLGVCNEFYGEDASMHNGSTAGTPAFRAPETLQTGQHLYSGKATDIWALGATLYSLVFGNVPFVASSVPAVYEKIKNDKIQFPEHIKISAELMDLLERMLDKDPSKRITLPQIKEHVWVTSNNTNPLPDEEANCRLVQISDEDINSVVKSIPKLDTLILIKTMLKKHSFQNPFTKGISGRAPQRGGSRLERFTRAGRSNSAPGAYHMIERQMSCDNILPSVSEGVVSPCSESSSDRDSVF